MAETLARNVWTDEALLALPRNRGKYELIDGQLTLMSPPKAPHGFIAVRIATALHGFAKPKRLGLVFAEAGFRLDADNVLAPDISFSGLERLRRENADLEGFVRGTPDLAVEIISSSERRKTIRIKTEKYFAQGTRLVWLVFPRRKIVEVYAGLGDKAIKQIGDDLDGGDLLPGFRLPLAEIFEDWF
jgi:Uma2 family endonuclease